MTNIFLEIKENMNYIGPNHLPTTLMLDICQDIDRLSSFSIKYIALMEHFLQGNVPLMHLLNGLNEN